MHEGAFCLSASPSVSPSLSSQTQSPIIPGKFVTNLLSRNTAPTGSQGAFREAGPLQEHLDIDALVRSSATQQRSL